MPWGMPGALAAVLAGTVIFWGRWAIEGAAGAPGPHPAITLGSLALALPLPTLAWLDALDATLPYLPLAVPFALATVVGGIDNTESAIVAGDEYRTRDILLTEAVATIAAGCCGGVIQNTPYIGHPAYKAMGARAGYTLATGLLIGVGAAVGVVAVLVRLLPEAAVAPILVFVGLEITAQAFLASPARHAAAVAISFLPAVAALVLIEGGLLLGGVGKSPADLDRRRRAPVGRAPGAGQRLHRDRAAVGLGGGRDHRAPPARRGRRPRGRERGHALRRRSTRRCAGGARVLAVVGGERGAARAGRRLWGRGAVAPAAAGSRRAR